MCFVAINPALQVSVWLQSWWIGLIGWHVGFIMGHEFTGVVTEVGSEVKTVKVGDKVVAPFTVSW
jgi:threonine dehydrogenase-like Zn-dependent dehydrogenase